MQERDVHDGKNPRPTFSATTKYVVQILASTNEKRAKASLLSRFTVDELREAWSTLMQAQMYYGDLTLKYMKTNKVKTERKFRRKWHDYELLKKKLRKVIDSVGPHEDDAYEPVRHAARRELEIAYRELPAARKELRDRIGAMIEELVKTLGISHARAQRYVDSVIS